jgi:hypothetical protein
MCCAWSHESETERSNKMGSHERAEMGSHESETDRSNKMGSHQSP